MSFGSGGSGSSSAKAHLPHVSTLSRPGTSPVSGQLYETASGGLAIVVSLFPLPFGHRHSLLGHPVPPGDWAPLAVGCLRNGWGWVSSVPRRRRCPHGQAMSLTAACHVAAACPCLPGITTRPRGVTITRHQRGFSAVHPMPSLPFACDSQTERESLGFPLSFTPGRAGPGRACQGRDGPWTLAWITSSTSADLLRRIHS